MYAPIAESQANPPNAARQTDVLTEPRLQNEKQAFNGSRQDFRHPKNQSDFGFNLLKTPSIDDTVFFYKLDDSLLIFAQLTPFRLCLCHYQSFFFSFLQVYALCSHYL